MKRVRILDKKVAEQIAAGEVIERPASVIKELVENSLDAGAQRIEIILKAGGKQLIRVIDDGWGMSPEDAQNALKRFATSKINFMEDLEKINTLGFRGEAVPSIAAVSKMTITTRETEALEGIKLVVQGGEVREKSPLGCPPGTIVEVSDLFYNLPARKKFLRSPGWEAARIIQWLGRMALYYLKIDFHLIHNQKEVLAFPAHSDEKLRLALLLGIEEENLISIKAEGKIGRVWGCIGKPELSFRNREGQVVFLNGRLVNNPLIYHAIKEGFGEAVEKGRHPVTLLFLEISGDKFDVNVHPTKAEVRFSEPKEVVSLIGSAIREAFQTYAIKVPEPAGQSSRYSLKEAQKERTYHLTPLPSGPSGFSRPASSPFSPREVNPPDLPETREEFTPLGQIDNTYLVGIYRGELILIDQHAAAERIAYEKLKAGGGERPTLQELLFPEIIELTAAQMELALENIEVFKDLGIRIEPFGENTVLLRSIPADLSGFDPKTSFGEILDELISELPSEKRSLRDQLYLTFACKGSLKAGKSLKPAEMNRLFSELLQVPEYSHCPHGRPTLVKMGCRELEKLFKR